MDHTLEYQLQPDDTLWELAEECNTTVEEILATNGTLDPNNMYVGQLIYLPVHSKVDALQRRPGRGPFRPGRRGPFRGFRTGGCPRGTFYTVQPGDSLFNIGLRFGVSPNAIAAANPFIDFRFPLQIGVVLCVPFL
jgi:Predicted glycosyl hydrolase